jgi:uncharacterized protein (TIGR00255 family)
MVKSMTGYGRYEDTASSRKISVELKSVNHKFFEFSCRLPRTMMFLEDRLKSYVQSRVARGKVDLFLTVEGDSDAPAVVEINHSLAAGYVKAYQQLAEIYSLPSNLTAEGLGRLPDVLTVHKAPEDEDALWAQVKAVAEKAVDAFIAMREQEGLRLKEDLLSRIATIRGAVAKIEAETPQTVAAYRARLEEKMRELLGSVSVDEQRLLTETAIFADRVAVDEETVRLRSHADQLENLLNQDGPVGRKLDFLMQEANREINTIGSKSQNTNIAGVVVEVKAELEKMREQIQNLE